MIQYFINHYRIQQFTVGSVYSPPMQKKCKVPSKTSRKPQHHWYLLNTYYTFCMLGTVLRALRRLPGLILTGTPWGNYLTNHISQLRKLRHRDVKQLVQSGTVTFWRKLQSKKLEAPGWRWPPGFLWGPPGFTIWNLMKLWTEKNYFRITENRSVRCAIKNTRKMRSSPNIRNKTRSQCWCFLVCALCIHSFTYSYIQHKHSTENVHSLHMENVGGAKI